MQIKNGKNLHASSINVPDAGLQSIVGIVMNLNFCQIWPNIIFRTGHYRQMQMTAWAEKGNK